MPSQTDYQYMQRMMRELVPDAFEKFYNETSIKTWSSLVQDDILHAAFALMDLITAQLKVTNGSLYKPWSWTPCHGCSGMSDTQAAALHSQLAGLRIACKPLCTRLRTLMDASLWGLQVATILTDGIHWSLQHIVHQKHRLGDGI